MTPLAHAIAKQMTIKPHKRKPIISANTKQLVYPETLVSDIHCFECTEVFDLACDLADSGKLNQVLDERIFVPAPRTWIEHKDADGRKGWLLTERPFTIQFVFDNGDGRYACRALDLTDGSEHTHGTLGLVLAMIAIINTPQIVSRETFEPHRGLDRLWTKRFRKAPLHAWTELKLRVSKPIEIEDDEPHSPVIGGKRALHFCRAHLRVRLGRLEFVSSHWRGDEALGKKLTRYHVGI